MIFVPAESTYGGIPSTNGAKDLASPYLAGFGFSRPKAKIYNMYGTRLEAEGSRGTSAPGQIMVDSYQHPEKRRYPGMPYSQAFDLYS